MAQKVRNTALPLFQHKMLLTFPQEQVVLSEKKNTVLAHCTSKGKSEI